MRSSDLSSSDPKRAATDAAPTNAVARPSASRTAAPADTSPASSSAQTRNAPILNSGQTKQPKSTTTKGPIPGQLEERVSNSAGAVDAQRAHPLLTSAEVVWARLARRPVARAYADIHPVAVPRSEIPGQDPKERHDTERVP